MGTLYGMVEKLPRVACTTWVHEQNNGIIRFFVPPPLHPHLPPSTTPHHSPLFLVPIIQSKCESELLSNQIANQIKVGGARTVLIKS